MHADIQFRRIKDQRFLRDRIAADLRAIQQRIPVERADIQVERVEEGSRFLRIRTKLAVPGVDLMAMASDYTLTATWNKVKKALLKQLDHRQTKRESKFRQQSIRGPMTAARA